MPLTLRDNLPFITITVTYQGTTMDIPQVLVDTGSATTLLAADIVATIGIVPLPQDGSERLDHQLFTGYDFAIGHFSDT
jgi:hypothetical protein